MKILKEKDVRGLKRKQSIKTLKGKELASVTPIKQPIAKTVAPEARQSQALERIAAEIMLLLQANDKNAVILLEMIKKIQMPEVPAPVKKWDFAVSRDGKGFIKSISAKAI